MEKHLRLLVEIISLKLMDKTLIHQLIYIDRAFRSECKVYENVRILIANSQKKKIASIVFKLLELSINSNALI